MYVPPAVYKPSIALVQNTLPPLDLRQLNT